MKSILNNIMKTKHTSTEGILLFVTISLFTGALLWALLGQAQTTPEPTTGYTDNEVRVNIESPVQLSTNANIGSIRGWAVHPDYAMTHVDMYVDGEFSFSVPVGGQRMDVEDAFPAYYQSIFSGWNQTVNWKSMADGYHVVEVRAFHEYGGYQSAYQEFCVTRFNKEFISDPAEIKLWQTERFHVWSDRIVFEGLEVEGRRWNMELSWVTATQSFEITQTTAYEFIDEYTEYECVPQE